MNYVNTHKPTNRTLAVIDGGLNLKASVEPLITTQKPRLLDQVRQAIRTRHYSYRTEKAYVHWIKRYIFFHDKRHPAEMAELEIGRFLSSLATEGHVSASTQNQAFNALLFLYHEVWAKRSGSSKVSCARRGLSDCRSCSRKDEVKKVIDHITGVAAFDGDSALWCRLTTDGMLPASSQGHRFFSQRDCCSIGKREQRSLHDATQCGSRFVGPTSSRRSCTTRSGSKTGAWSGFIAGCSGPKIFQRR